MELAYLWGWFQRLSARRQSGMAANPITFTELDAFCRRALIEPTAWEISVLMRVDDAVLATIGQKSAKRSKAAPEDPDPATKKAGLLNLFRGLAAQKRKP